ncbi:hypothetical protein CF98_17300 [Halopseudomonas bauzanensis]|nr:hypothetical protein CF98_17300 [Halopseudomonas bauzanensis]
MRTGIHFTGGKLSSWCSTIPGGSLVEAGVYGRIGIPGRFEHQLVPFTSGIALLDGNAVELVLDNPGEGISLKLVCTDGLAFLGGSSTSSCLFTSGIALLDGNAVELVLDNPGRESR